MNPTIRFEERSLPHQLTAEERERKGLELAHSTAEADRIEAEGKRVAKNYKAQLDTAESQVRAQAAVLNQGYEYRETKCRRILDLEDDTLTVVREDTGEVVETRRLNTTERRELEASRQPALPGLEEVSAPGPIELRDEAVEVVDQVEEMADAFAPDPEPANPDGYDPDSESHKASRIQPGESAAAFDERMGLRATPLVGVTCRLCDGTVTWSPADQCWVHVMVDTQKRQHTPQMVGSTKRHPEELTAAEVADISSRMDEMRSFQEARHQEFRRQDAERAAILDAEREDRLSGGGEVGDES